MLIRQCSRICDVSKKTQITTEPHGTICNEKRNRAVINNGSKQTDSQPKTSRVNKFVKYNILANLYNNAKYNTIANPPQRYLE